jgi:hypothetical protein
MEGSRDEGRGSPGERSREKREMMREKSRCVTIYPPSTLFLNELTNERTRHLVQRRERLLPCRTRILSRSKGRGREGRGGVAEQQDDARPRQPRARAAPPPLRLSRCVAVTVVAGNRVRGTFRDTGRRVRNIRGARDAPRAPSLFGLSLPVWGCRATRDTC